MSGGRRQGWLEVLGLVEPMLVENVRQVTDNVVARFGRIMDAGHSIFCVATVSDRGDMCVCAAVTRVAIEIEVQQLFLDQLLRDLEEQDSCTALSIELQDELPRLRAEARRIAQGMIGASPTEAAARATAEAEFGRGELLKQLLKGDKS